MEPRHYFIQPSQIGPLAYSVSELSQ